MEEKASELRPCRLLNRGQLLDIIPLSYPTIWNLMRRDLFPRAIVVGKAKLAWREDEILQWIDSRPRQILKGDPPESKEASPRYRESASTPDADDLRSPLSPTLLSTEYLTWIPFIFGRTEVSDVTKSPSSGRVARVGPGPNLGLCPGIHFGPASSSCNALVTSFSSTWTTCRKRF